MTEDEDDDLLSRILPSQAERAGRSGMVGESLLEAIFNSFGIRIVNDNPEYHMYFANGADFFPRKERMLIRKHQVLGQRIDFLYKDFATGLSLPIECINQMGSGTTDQKLSFTIEELLKICSHKKFPAFWLVLTGDGFSPRVTQAMNTKVAKLNRNQNEVRGRIIFNAGTLLQRAIERLIEQNDPDGSVERQP